MDLQGSCYIISPVLAYPVVRRMMVCTWNKQVVLTGGALEMPCSTNALL